MNKKLDKELIKEHRKAKYFATIESIPHIRGLMIKLPKNIFKKLPEQTIIYEIDNSSIKIFINKNKVETIKVPNYAARNFVVCDVVKRLVDIGMSMSLVKFVKDGKEIKDENIQIRTLIAKSDDELVNEKEALLEAALSDSKTLESPEAKEVAEGIDIIFKSLEGIYK